MNGMIMENNNEKSYGKSNTTMWVSHMRQCISFRKAENFEQNKFDNESEMWNIIRRLVDMNYLIQ